MKARLFGPMTQGAAYASLFLFVFSLLLASANLFWTAHEVNAQSHQWCSALNLLTAHPVPKPVNPAANPSRVQAYRYYLVFLDLHNRFGC